MSKICERVYFDQTLYKNENKCSIVCFWYITKNCFVKTCFFLYYEVRYFSKRISESLVLRKRYSKRYKDIKTCFSWFAPKQEKLDKSKDKARQSLIWALVKESLGTECSCKAVGYSLALTNVDKACTDECRRVRTQL